MKYIVTAGLLALATASMAADTYTHGYTRRDGTYVQPHYSSTPNDTKIDNYSTRGNTNPYTAERGTVDPLRERQPQNYGSPYDNNPRRSRSGF